MRLISPLVCLAIFANSFLFAEGTHELAPNGTIMIGANTTTDLAALHINHPSYNNFASYTNPDPKSRLYIHVLDPQTECIYVGFSFSHANENVPNPVQRPFEFRIKDPNGNVVFGPVNMDPSGVNIHNWSEGFTGPMQIHGAGGYDGILVSGADLASQGWSGKGDFYIEFRNDADSDLLIDFWDITVADCSGATPTEKKGRIWSYNWSIFAVNDFGFPNRPFDGAFYVCAPDPDNMQASFVTRIDFNGSGFRPAAFNIAFNSFGSMNTGNVAEDRKSVRNQNATQSEYSIFLNDPVEICQTAEIGSIDLLGVSRCDANSYCIKFSASKAGQVDLLLDFDGGDNIYTPGTADLMISQTITADEVNIPTCIAWDGKDGLGNLISDAPGTQIPVTIAFEQGIYHFPIYDAELMTTGVTLQAVRPAAPNPSLYYDDSNIGVPSGSGEPIMQLSGCTTPCHTWTNYTQPNTIGFGNLCTINSWWFSQLIIRQDVFFLPAYYACEIQGPTHFCQGGTDELTIKPNVLPAGSQEPEIVDIHWSGPGVVGADNNNSVVVDEPGLYTVEFKWLTGLGDTCSSSCGYEVTTDPPSSSSIDTLIVHGDVIEINGETYDHGGQFVQTLSTSSGCDSLLYITIRELNTVVHYNLDACYSTNADNSAMDYSEFVPAYLEPLSCADISGSTVSRSPPQENKHSCTPGVNNSIAMCVSALDDCTYQAGNNASVIFSLVVSPDPDTAVQITGLSFYSRAPVNFNWINGPSGPNDFPKFYGLRILKNGTEIFRIEDVPTTQTWNLENYDFKNDHNFIVDAPTTFRFEILPYCLFGNGADVAAYDMDEISIQASCISPSILNPLVSGVVKTSQLQPVHNVDIRLGDDPSLQQYNSSTTNANGQYAFDHVKRNMDHYVKGYKNDDPLNGVSTLDLIRIQKHLLGITPFSSPYEYIAADANRSNSVTAIDLIEFRKLILGIYQSLPRNTSWRFGNAKLEPDISNPWSLQECIGIEYLTSDISDVDFIGIKIGDLNGDVKTNLSSSIQPRTTTSVHFQYENQWIAAGQPVEVAITATDFNDIMGLQMALHAGHIRIVDVHPGILDLNDTEYYIDDNGELKISWNTVHPVSAGSNTSLFTITLVSDQGAWLQNLLNIDESHLHAEAYQGDDLSLASVSIGSRPADSGEVTNDFEIFPNPVTNEANLLFSLNREQTCMIRFFDASGRLLRQQEIAGVPGTNKLTIHTADLGINDGLVICQLEANGARMVQRMVVLK